MENDFLFVIPTASKNYDAEKMGCAYASHPVILLTENKRPILQALLSVRDDKTYIKNSRKHVVCIHDDLWIKDKYFETRIYEAFERYDYWGIAGTNAVSVNEPKWHITPAGNKKKNFGFVEHDSEGMRYVTSFGAYPGNAVIVDGVFMAFRREVFDRFLEDPSYDGFHMYDLELCTQAFAMGYKGGVQGIYTYHESRGDGIHTSEWLRLAEVYKKKWLPKYKIISNW